MSTSELPDAGALPLTDLAGAMTREIERVANELFKGGAAPALPNALNVGGGGASSAVTAPPIPGVVHAPPIAATPPPREGDLRSIPTQLAYGLGLSPLTFIRTPEPSDDTPYFLGLAGLPTAAPASIGAGSVTPPMPGGVPSGPGLTPPMPAGLPSGLGLTPPMPGGVPSGLGLNPPMPGGVPSGVGSTPPLPTSPGADTAVPSLPTSADPVSVPAVAPAVAVPGGAPSATQPSYAYAFDPELVPELGASGGMFDPNVVKRDFPILRETVHGRPLVWLDNAATTQKPNAVIERLKTFYERENSNVHRAAHTLAARSTDAYESAREKVRRFLNAPSTKNIVFVRGATEGINLVAQSWGRRNIEPGDEIVITWLEHHANIVPWQQLASEKKARLKVAPVDSRGQIILEEYEKLLGQRTRIVSLTQVSNALGTVTPAREMVEMAHRHGAVVLVDGAQAVSHMPVDVQALDADFYVFSGHKVFAPTGIGALYGKSELLETMPPWQGGGNMIADVTFEKTVYQPAPSRFEAGTGSIGDAVGLGAAIDYVTSLGLVNIERYEHELRIYAEEQLACVPGLTMIGTAPEKAGVLSFVLDGVRTEDVGGILDKEGIAVRSGHHCAQPILRRFGLEATVRASLAPYNTREDIDILVRALKRIQVGRPPT